MILLCTLLVHSEGKRRATFTRASGNDRILTSRMHRVNLIDSNRLQRAGEHSCVVYCVTNRANGKKYVGITKGLLGDRWKAHVDCAVTNGKKRGVTKFSRAIRKYGAVKFDLVVMQQCSSPAELPAAEIKWIAELDTYHVGYNSTLGGEGCSGMVLTVETREKMSRVRKGIKFSDETRRRMSEAHQGVPLSAAARESMRLAQQNRAPISEETRAKFRTIAQNRSSETRQKMSDARKGVLMSEETKEKLRAANLGKKSSAETRAKISAWAMKPESREKQRQAHLRENLTAETLEKMGRATRRAIMKCDLSSGAELERFDSITAPALSAGVTGGAITHVLHGRARQCGGFFWKFATQTE